MESEVSCSLSYFRYLGIGRFFIGSLGSTKEKGLSSLLIVALFGNKLSDFLLLEFIELGRRVQIQQIQKAIEGFFA